MCQQEKDHQDRLFLLRKMRLTLGYTGTPFVALFGRTPRSLKAWIWTMPFFFISMSFLSHSWVGMVGFVVGVIVWLVVYKRTPAETWSDRVCKILMEYQQPFDEQAYQVLLKKIKEDTAGRVDIVAWLKAEEKLVRRLDRPSIEKELIDSRLQDNGASK